MGTMIDITGEKAFSAYLAKPETQTRGAVIVIHEAWGLVDHIKSVADRVAEEGYVALAPNLLSETDIAKIPANELQQIQEDLFNPDQKHRTEVQPKLRTIMSPMHSPEFGKDTIAKVKACFAYLDKMSEVRGKVAVMGFCFGGTYSFSLAIAEPTLKLSLPFYGGCDASVDELAQIGCPVRAFYGERDERLITQLPELKDKMKEAGVNFEAKIYPGTGHAFFNDSNPYAYNREAAEDAWGRVLGLLKEYLR
jgi:carboxymethylenebutenolidase